MINPDINASAFPDPVGGDPNHHGDYDGGMRLSEYASIHLQTEHKNHTWLNNLVVGSLRHKFAGQAMQALITRGELTNMHEVARQAYAIADAMVMCSEE